MMTSPAFNPESSAGVPRGTVTTSTPDWRPRLRFIPSEIVTSCAPATPLGETPNGRGSGMTTGAGGAMDAGARAGIGVRGTYGAAGANIREGATSGGVVNTHELVASRHSLP